LERKGSNRLKPSGIRLAEELKNDSAHERYQKPSKELPKIWARD